MGSVGYWVFIISVRPLRCGCGVLRLDSALRQARLDECDAELSGWCTPSLKLRQDRWDALCEVDDVLGRGFAWGMVGDVIEHQS